MCGASGILCCFNGFAASIYEGLCIFHHFIGSDCRSERFTLHILCNASEFGATEKKKSDTNIDRSTRRENDSFTSVCWMMWFWWWYESVLESNLYHFIVIDLGAPQKSVAFEWLNITTTHSNGFFSFVFNILFAFLTCHSKMSSIDTNERGCVCAHCAWFAVRIRTLRSKTKIK